MPLLFNFILEVLARAIGHKKRNKGIQIGKGKVELSLPANDNTLYIDKPEEIHKKSEKASSVRIHYTRSICKNSCISLH